MPVLVKLSEDAKESVNALKRKETDILHVSQQLDELWYKIDAAKSEITSAQTSLQEIAAEIQESIETIEKETLW